MVKILSRDAINRMVGRKSSVAGVGGGGGDVDLSGYATKIWTQETFVSIDFFRSLFRAYDSQNHEILPNDTDSTIDNIKAMFGFWTEQYISALGQGTGGGGGGVGDVTWDLLANNSDTRQIALSHLTTALSGYVTTSDISDMATQTWVTNNYLTQTAASSTYLTQTAASETYLSKTDAASTYLTQTAASSTYLSIAFFDRLFQAYAGTGSSAIRINPNDTTSTIDNVKAMFGFWTEQYISALGQGTGGGGGGVGDVTWDLLANNSDTRQIALSHLTTALSGYALTSQLPTKVSQLTNDSGFITSLGDCFRYQGLVTNDYVTGTTYSTITNGSYQRQLSGSTDSLLHFQIGGSASGLDIRFSYTQDNSNPLQYRKCIDSNRFAGGWVTLIDSLNIGSYLGSYLPLSGGTISGTLTVNSTTRGWGIHGYSVYNNEFSSAFLTYAGHGAWIGVSTNDSSHYILNVRKNISGDGSGGDAVIYARSDGNVGIGTDSPAYPLDVNGYSRSVYMLFKNYNDNNNAGYVGRGSDSNNNIYLAGYAGNPVGIGANNSATDIYIDTNHNVGIGTTSINYKLHVNGVIYSNTGVYSAGYVTALSDESKKDVIKDVELTVEQVAEAPSKMFTWKDKHDEDIHVGSIAQYWKKILPETVIEKDDVLSMDYSVISLASVITTARKVVDHERRIAELERENKELKLKLKIASDYGI